MNGLSKSFNEKLNDILSQKEPFVSRVESLAIEEPEFKNPTQIDQTRYDKARKDSQNQINTIQSILLSFDDYINGIEMTDPARIYPSKFKYDTASFTTRLDIVSYMNRYLSKLKLFLMDLAPPVFLVNVSFTELGQFLVYSPDWYEDNLDEKRSELDAKVSINEGLFSRADALLDDAKIKGWIREITSMRYHGFLGPDKSLYLAKKRALDVVAMELDRIQKLRSKTGFYLSQVPDAYQAIEEQRLWIETYHQTAEAFRTDILGVVQAYQQLSSVVSSEINLSQFDQRLADWAGGVKSLFDASQVLFETAEFPFPFSGGFVSEKSADTAWFNRQRSRKNRTVILDKMAKIQERFIEQEKQIKVIWNPINLEWLTYPLYKERPMNMGQEIVDEERASFREKLSFLESSWKSDVSLVEQIESDWEKNKDVLEKLMTLDDAEDPLYVGFFAEFDESVDQLNQAATVFGLKMDALIERVEKDEVLSRQFDDEARDRGQKYESRIRFRSFTTAIDQVKKLAEKFDKARPLFDVYEATDQDAMLTLYAYLKSVYAEADKVAESAVSVFYGPVHPHFQMSVKQGLEQSASLVARLKKEILELDQVFLSKKIDPPVASPISDFRQKQDIILGRKDSDGDGITDRFELNLGTDPLVP